MLLCKVVRAATQEEVEGLASLSGEHGFEIRAHALAKPDRIHEPECRHVTRAPQQ